MHQILRSCVEGHCPHSRTLSRETCVLLSIGYKLQHNDGTFSKTPLGINMKKPVLWGRIQGRNNRSKEWESFSQAGNAAARYHLKATEKHMSEPKTRGCDDEQTIKCGCYFSYICNFAVLVSDIINIFFSPQFTLREKLNELGIKFHTESLLPWRMRHSNMTPVTVLWSSVVHNKIEWVSRE